MIKDLEKLVRDGQFKKAWAMLKEVRLSEIARDQRLAYASVAGRLGELNMALRILNPVIRGPGRQSATAEEKLQYANSLRKLGAVEEAIDIISEIRPRHSEALLHLAFCLQSQWRYKEAIPLLEEAVSSGGLEPYRLIVSKVNLLAAYVSERSVERASALAGELLASLENGTSRLLHGNVLELSAQIDIHSSDFAAAYEKLGKARALLSEAQGSTSTIFVEKWMAIGRSLEAGRPTDELLAIRQKAVEQGHWETVRDCEFYCASLTGDRSTFIKLYFGTPHAEFRERIEKMGIDIPGTWDYGEGASPARILDLKTGVMDDGGFFFEPGQALHRLVIAVSQDLYRPFPLLSLFSRLFPGEHFNPDSSPNRVHQILKRYRKVDIGVEVEESLGNYRLKTTGATAVRLSRESIPMNTEELKFLKLRASLKQENFTTEDAVTAMNISRSSAQRLLKWAAENRKVIPGNGPGKIRFKFAA